MPYSQKDRMCRVVSPLGDDALLVQQLAATESVSGLFTCKLDLISELEDIPFDQIMGKPLSVGVHIQDARERWFHGIVSRFEQGAAQERFVAYRAEIVPWFWLLTRRMNCRIFQHLSVPDIAKKIFGELGFSDFKLELSGTHPPREYCVQYRESDFHFLSRLFEDEGIGYFFEHEEKAHTLVLFDTPDAHQPCPGQPKAMYQSASDKGSPSGDVRNMCFERELRPGGYALTDYNFEQPSLSLLTTTSSPACIGSRPDLEVYDYPGDFYLPPDGDTRIKLRMQIEECASVRVHGESHCVAFTPGYRFDLEGHYRDSCNEPYLITEVHHALTDSVGQGGDGEQMYQNTFAAIPHCTPYRPQRTTRRPTVRGVQTATVVGAAGQEIDVDEHARVVVQFHWDREGKRDAKSSCRVRVAQNWAGKGWGLIAHPRIGQEVIVEFLEGDPDRPIITGRVYNGEQMAPYGLPANSTQTGIKSRSSPGGGGFNEIRFEDKAGNELVYVQAQKDRSTLTKNDDSQSVGNDRSRAVGNNESVSVGVNQKIDVGTDRTRSVGANESISIGSNRTKSVGADESVTIGSSYSQSVGASRTRSVGGSETVTVAAQRTHTVGVNETISIGAAQEVTVGAARALTVGGAQTTSIGAVHSVSVGANESVSVGGKQSVSVASDRTLQVSGGLTESVGKDYTHSTSKNITIKAGTQIALVVGSAKIIMKKNGDITIEGKTITVKGSGKIVMKGQKILEN